MNEPDALGRMTLALSECAQLLSEPDTPQERLEQVLGRLRELTGASRAALFLPGLSPDLVVASTLTDDHGRLRSKLKRLAGIVLDEDAASRISAVPSDPSPSASLDDEEHLALPVGGVERVRGLLLIEGLPHDGLPASLVLQVMTIVAAQLGAFFTAQRLVEEQRQLRDVEEERARLLELFIGTLGHDLRSPLNAILLGSSVILAQEAQLPDALVRVAVRIRRSTERMSRMVSDLLDFARSRQGPGLVVVPTQVDLGEVCRNTSEEVSASHPGRTVQIDVQGDVLGYWDGGRIGQVVQNLVGNALKYSPDGSTVGVTARDLDDQILLEVRNSGDPIAPDMIPLLFDPFRTGQSPGAERTDSSGLGLYIARQIVLAHAGQITITSSHDDGTRATVVLPRRPPRRDS